MVQMRSMRLGLRHFLYKINEPESDKCPCGEGSQTLKHIVLQGGTFGQLRRELFDRLQDMTDYASIMGLICMLWARATTL
jgi:hypothetical protein